MASITVRGREPADAAALTALFNCPGVVAGTLQLPLRAVEERRLRYAQPDAHTHALVAEFDARVVGSLGLAPAGAPRRRHCGDLGMAVHDAFQGRGVGGALLAAALDLADNWLGLRRVALTVYTDNAPAIHLYEQFGFVVEGTLRDYAFRAGTYVDAHQMARLRQETTALP